MNTKTRFICICCLQEIHLRSRKTKKLIVRGQKKVSYASGNQEKNGIRMLEKIGFKIKSVYKKQKGFPGYTRGKDPVTLLSSCSQSFPASGSFPVSQIFVLSGQNIEVSSFSYSPSNAYSGLISFRIDSFYLFAVQETLKSLLQHHNLKASVLQHSAFFMVQFSHPCTTTGKTIVLTIKTFISNKMSLFFNMMLRFAIVFLPKSKKCLLTSWMQSTSAVNLDPKNLSLFPLFPLQFAMK